MTTDLPLLNSTWGRKIKTLPVKYIPFESQTFLNLHLICVLVWDKQENQKSHKSFMYLFIYFSVLELILYSRGQKS